jgi:hypothetical protein
VAFGRKAAEAIARIETKGCPRVSPPYGGTLERLPAAFWERFEESLNGSGAEEALDAAEWSLMRAAHDLGYDAGLEVVGAANTRRLLRPLQVDPSSALEALHATFCALSGIGADDCEIVELVPFERLVLRVYGYWGLLVPSPGRNRRRGTLVVRGLCAALMDVAYGIAYDECGCHDAGTYLCRQSRSVGRGDTFDEFVATRT